MSANHSAKASVGRAIDYIVDEEKTEGGKLVLCSDCTAENAAEHFLSIKEMYDINAVREYENPILAYSIRQSFAPGEVTPEQALELGNELALRITEGQYASVIATHTNTEHIHNHIIINAYNNDCQTKFYNPYMSYKDIRELCDEISRENNLSVVEEPKLGNNLYTRIEEYKQVNNGKSPPRKEELQLYIDTIFLSESPRNLEDFYSALRNYNCTVKDKSKDGKPLKNVSVKLPNHEKAIRLNSLAEGYTEKDIEARINRIREEERAQFEEQFYGDLIIIDERQEEQKHNPHSEKKPIIDTENIKKEMLSASALPYLSGNIIEKMIDLEYNLRYSMKAESSPGFKSWAQSYNLKLAAETLLFLQQNDLVSYDRVETQASAVEENISSIKRNIRSNYDRMKGISELQKHIGAYNKNRAVFSEYMKSKRNPNYRRNHTDAIEKCEAAKQFFDGLGFDKLPKYQDLKDEYATLQGENNQLYAELKSVQSNGQTILNVRENLQTLLASVASEARNEKAAERTSTRAAKQKEGQR